MKRIKLEGVWLREKDGAKAIWELPVFESKWRETTFGSEEWRSGRIHLKNKKDKGPDPFHRFPFDHCYRVIGKGHGEVEIYP